MGCQTRRALAVVNGRTITAEEVEKCIGQLLRRLEEQIYLVKRQKIETLIDDQLITARM